MLRISSLKEQHFRFEVLEVSLDYESQRPPGRGYQAIEGGKRSAARAGLVPALTRSSPVAASAGRKCHARTLCDPYQMPTKNQAGVGGAGKFAKPLWLTSVRAAAEARSRR